MAIKKIIKGHINEMFNIHGDMAEGRMKICKNCPLYKMSESFGPICNPKLHLNSKTEEISDTPQPGFIKGCGCRLNAKTRDVDSHCPSNKW